MSALTHLDMANADTTSGILGFALGQACARKSTGRISERWPTSERRGQDVSPYLCARIVAQNGSKFFRLGTKRSFSTESAPRADIKIEVRDLAELGEIGL
jgi:hypothetical protein